MIKLTFWATLVLAGIAGASYQASPSSSEFEQGSVSGNTYTNSALGITWEFPKDWTVQNKTASLLGTDYRVILSLSPSGTQSKESIELSYSAAGSSQANSALGSAGWEPSGHVGYYTLGGGIPAHRTDYKSKSEPTRYLAFFDGEHHGTLGIVLTAESIPRMEELTKAVVQMKVQPDWGSLAPAGRRVRISQSTSEVFLDHKVQPNYPDAARKQHVEGSVVMLANISAEGSVENLYVLTGEPTLIQAALDAVSQWRYRPYLLQGSPAEVETRITIRFTLR